MPALSALLAPERKVVQRGSAMPSGDEGGEVEHRVAMAVRKCGGDADVRCMGASDGRRVGFPALFGCISPFLIQLALVHLPRRI